MPGQTWECEKHIISRVLRDTDIITLPHLRRQFPETSIILKRQFDPAPIIRTSVSCVVHAPYVEIEQPRTTSSNGLLDYLSPILFSKLAPFRYEASKGDEAPST